MDYYDDPSYLIIRLVAALVFGTIFGFVGKSMLEKKGRSGGAGFALGFFLGLIGIIICAVMSESPERQMARMQMMQRGGYPPIPGQAYPPPMYPPQSGYPPQPMYPSQGFPPQPPQPIPMGTVSTACKSCGTALIPGAAFCPSCGTKV